MVDCNVDAARDHIRTGLAQIETGIKEIDTLVQAAMYAYHVADRVADDKE